MVFTTLDSFSCSSRNLFSLVHLFSLLLLIEHLQGADTILDAGNTATNKADEVHVLMELTLGMTKMILGGGKCRKDVNWEELGCKL